MSEENSFWKEHEAAPEEEEKKVLSDKFVQESGKSSFRCYFLFQHHLKHRFFA